jgi:hypothetical protein
MRQSISLVFLACTLSLTAWANPTATESDLRSIVSEWVETMRKIQKEEDDWARDQEVLQHYKEGLEREIADLRQKIADAEIRKAGADKESLAQSAERDRLAAAKDSLAVTLRGLEEQLVAALPLMPSPLLSEAKVAQGVEELRKSINLPEEKRGDNVSKRLLNVINLLSEAEKFQQTVSLRNELHRDGNGREFNMQVVYFGLAAAYAVNEESTFALVGKPDQAGWRFEERPDLATEIRRLIDATTGDAEAAFIQLPLPKP